MASGEKYALYKRDCSFEDDKSYQSYNPLLRLQDEENRLQKFLERVKRCYEGRLQFSSSLPLASQDAGHRFQIDKTQRIARQTEKTLKSLRAEIASRNSLSKALLLRETQEQRASHKNKIEKAIENNRAMRVRDELIAALEAQQEQLAVVAKSPCELQQELRLQRCNKLPAIPQAEVEALALHPYEIEFELLNKRISLDFRHFNRCQAEVIKEITLCGDSSQQLELQNHVAEYNKVVQDGQIQRRESLQSHQQETLQFESEYQLKTRTAPFKASVLNILLAIKRLLKNITRLLLQTAARVSPKKLDQALAAAGLQEVSAKLREALLAAGLLPKDKAIKSNNDSVEQVHSSNVISGARLQKEGLSFADIGLIGTLAIFDKDSKKIVDYFSQEFNSIMKLFQDVDPLLIGKTDRIVLKEDYSHYRNDVIMDTLAKLKKKVATGYLGHRYQFAEIAFVLHSVDAQLRVLFERVVRENFRLSKEQAGE